MNIRLKELWRSYLVAHTNGWAEQGQSLLDETELCQRALELACEDREITIRINSFDVPFHLDGQSPEYWYDKARKEQKIFKSCPSIPDEIRDKLGLPQRDPSKNIIIYHQQSVGSRLYFDPETSLWTRHDFVGEHKQGVEVYINGKWERPEPQQGNL
jgi:hypothetical protein